MKTESRLDEREMEILQLLWQHGPQKPVELQDKLSFRIKNSALRWLLNDLVTRRQLHRRKEGKAFLYQAAIERRPFLAAVGQTLRNALFGGSALAMIGELIEVQKLSPKDIDYLQRIASGLESTKKSKAQGKP